MDIKTLLDNEIDILLAALDRLKIYDISLSYTADGQITARDYENQWTAKEFYEFLLNEAISYQPDGTSAVMAENTCAGWGSITALSFRLWSRQKAQSGRRTRLPFTS